MKEEIDDKKCVFSIGSSAVLLNVEVRNREEAIACGCSLLIKEEAVTKEYCDSILKSLELYGPYFVIAPHFAIPHARNENGSVKKFGISFVRVSKPVYFGNSENDPVNMILTLASPDETTHIKFLARLSSLFTSESTEILKYGNIEQVRTLLDCLLNDE